jgi:hypothetical protein
MRSRAWIAALLVAGVSACGSNDDRFELRTPGTENRVIIRELPGSAEVRRGKPPREEVAVIRGWADALRAGHVAEAARFFALPTEVSPDGQNALHLEDRGDVMKFNRRLPCGARLIATERGDDSLVIATFRLTERPGRGSCGQGVGEPAATAFLIEDQRIARWLRVAVPERHRQRPPADRDKS